MYRKIKTEDEEKNERCLSGEHSGREALTFRDEDYRTAAAMFAALGDPSRLKLVEYLSRGEACVSEIAAVYGDGLSTISQRLKLLRSERLVKKRRDGKHIYYSLADEHVEQLVRNALQHAEEY